MSIYKTMTSVDAVLSSPTVVDYNTLLSLSDELYDRMESILELPDDTENMKRIQQFIKVTDFYNRPDDSPLTSYIERNYGDFPPEYNFEDSAPDPSISNSMVSSLLSTV